MSSILKRGSHGPSVRDLQLLLNRAGAALVVDRDFGKKTETAVKAFQKRVGLVVDGLAGPQTLAALKQTTAAPKTPPRKEPDKSAMNEPTPAPVGCGPDRLYLGEPPNAASLKLLDTSRAIGEIIIHCAATPEGRDFTVADIRAWHKARGFTDIGYHYVVYRDGRIMLGRPIGQIGAHVSGHNTGTIGISYIGGVSADGKTAKDTRTPEQGAALLWLVKELVAKHRGVRKITGHNQYAAKACPSFDVRTDALGQVL